MHTMQLLYIIYIRARHDGSRPIASLFLFQQLKDGLSIHVRRGVEPSDVEDCRSKVNVQHHMRISEEEHANKV